MSQNQSYDLVIVGAGPAGLSAAGRAAEIDREQGRVAPSYILLESGAELAQTIQAYQLGKHVMDEPGFLNLRSPMRFESGTREAVLDTWEADVRAAGLNIRYHSEVTRIRGAAPAFEVTLADGQVLTSRAVVLACGTQGNLRLLEVPNDAPSDFIRYGLADPAAITGRTVVVVGAGDSAIENALALVGANSVHIVNRRSEFSRAKSGNLNGIVAAINNDRVDMTCHYDSKVKAVELPPFTGAMGRITLTTPSGETTIDCDLVIARLGSIPPRKFLEECGIVFSSRLPGALPVIDARYQSAVPGLYVIGALSGYPLIKQAMNQGQDVVDYIAGNEIQPADHELVVSRLGGLYADRSVDSAMDGMHRRSPLFASVSPIVFRELVIESRFIANGVWADGLAAADDTGRGPLVRAAGDQLLAPGDFINAFYLVLEGSLLVRRYPDADWEEVGAGGFFGESCLFAGRPQTSSVSIRRNSVIMQIPRRVLIKLALSNDQVKEQLEEAFVLNLLRVTFEPKIAAERVRAVSRRCVTRTFEAGELLYEEGSPGDRLYLLRSGTINLLQGAQRQVVADQYAGELIGQMSLMGNPRRMTAACAATRVDVVEIDADAFTVLLEDNPVIRARLERDLTLLLQENNTLFTHAASASAMAFMMDQGVGEATNALVIDATLCIGCDNCERACEATHDGVSRLQRGAGSSYERFHVPISCRHCETPHCMKDCPPDAIHRTESGAVYIADNCIGCGNCESNCPYGAIDLVAAKPTSRGLLSWLPRPSWGRRAATGHESTETSGQAVKRAVKCDACHALPGGPACVRACPTGAALRLGAGELLSMIEG